MSLRARLLIGLVVLLVAGLAAFGIATYSFYAPSQYQHLDDQLRSSAGLVTIQLERLAGITPPRVDAAGSGGGSTGQPGGGGQGLGGGSQPGGGGGSQPGGGGGSIPAGGGQGPGGPPPVEVPLGTYGELINQGTGKVLGKLQYGTSTTYRPALPKTIPAPGAEGTLLTTGSTGSNGTAWRVLVISAPGLPGRVVAVAFPTSTVDSALSQLIVVELSVAGALLALLVSLAWVLLRRGMRPLEQMASEASTISGADVSHRVGPAQGPTEVVELGRALDRMLDGIEGAFAERDATEARLRQFLADASHELRTPLTSIKGFAELLRIGATKGHLDEKTIVARIESEAARMGRLVEDLLLLARLDEARSPRSEEIDLVVLAADACSDGVAAAPDRRFSLDAPAPAVVRGDEDHLRQAIANLVTNAIRHTPAGTAIDVTVEVTEGMAAVAVRDHGDGLDEQALTHVFDRFWRADTARVGEGAGLGLAIVAAVATEHGGSVTAVNAAGEPGRGGGTAQTSEPGGAVFAIRLPSAEVRPPEVGD